MVFVLLFSTLCPSFAVIWIGKRVLANLLSLPDVLWQTVFAGSS